MNNSVQNIPYKKDDDYIECCKITLGLILVVGLVVTLIIVYG